MRFLGNYARVRGLGGGVTFDPNALLNQGASAAQGAVTKTLQDAVKAVCAEVASGVAKGTAVSNAAKKFGLLKPAVEAALAASPCPPPKVAAAKALTAAQKKAVRDAWCALPVASRTGVNIVAVANKAGVTVAQFGEAMDKYTCPAPPPAGDPAAEKAAKLRAAQLVAFRATWCSLPAAMRTPGNANLIAAKDGIPLAVTAEVMNGPACTTTEARCAPDQVFVDGAGCRPLASTYPGLFAPDLPPDTVIDAEDPPFNPDDYGRGYPDPPAPPGANTPLLLGAAAALGLALVLMRKQAPRANRRRRR